MPDTIATTAPDHRLGESLPDRLRHHRCSIACRGRSIAAHSEPRPKRPHYGNLHLQLNGAEAAPTPLGMHECIETVASGLESHLLAQSPVHRPVSTLASAPHRATLSVIHSSSVSSRHETSRTNTVFSKLELTWTAGMRNARAATRRQFPRRRCIRCSQSDAPSAACLVEAQITCESSK